MALLTLAKLIDDVRDEIPNAPQAKIVRAVNKVIRRIQTEFTEPAYSTFTTRVSTTSGTVAVTQDSTAVTFSGTPLASSDGVMLIQVDGDTTWFLLTYVSTSTGTLSSKWAASTNATATYTIVYPAITFPKEVGEILRIKHQQYGYLQYRIGGRHPAYSGTPTAWSPYVHDETSVSPADDCTRIFLDPAPSSRFLYQYWYLPRTVFLDPAGSTSQTIPLPDVWYESLVQGTLFWLWKQESRKEQYVTQSAVYELCLSRARGSSVSGGVIDPRGRGEGSMWAYEDRPIGGT